MTASPVRRFFAGPRFLARGLRLWVTSPRLMFLGALPALIVSIVYTVIIVVFAINLDAITVWLTQFAEGWDEPWAILARVVAGLAAIGVVVLAAVFTFTAITLVVGDPFYERIWREVERRESGVVPESSPGLARGIANALRLFAATAAIGVVLFVCGLIPLLGQTVVPVVAALVGGWFLTVELCGFAFDARGLSLRERRRMLAANRAGTLGFGVVTYLLFLIPLGAVFVMPAAVAGATLLSRSAIGSTDAIAAPEAGTRGEIR